MSLSYKILPRYVNGQDMAPASARKTEKVYLSHVELLPADADGVPYVTGVEEAQADALLSDPTVEQVADALALAEELIAAAIVDAGGAA